MEIHDVGDDVDDVSGWMASTYLVRSRVGHVIRLPQLFHPDYPDFPANFQGGPCTIFQNPV